jgi:cobalt-precorrin 5A hydrolase
VKIALISLSRQGARVAHVLAAHLAESQVYLHRGVGKAPGTRRFDHVADLARGLFARWRGLVFIGPAGIAVRAVAPLLGDKRTDPAVVVVDVGGRWAVSLLGGHEGGANELAAAVSNILSAEPVIITTTTTEAAKTIIVGIGCRRGTPAPERPWR